jgi:hypothetical protein
MKRQRTGLPSFDIRQSSFNAVLYEDMLLWQKSQRRIDRFVEFSLNGIGAGIRGGRK